MNARKLLLGSALLTVLSACASQPDDIAASSVSPLQYREYTCEQLSFEAVRISTRTNELYSQLEKKADNDSAQMAVGLILFWPTLFFLEGGDGAQASEYAKLKGERQAVEHQAILKECSIKFPDSPEVIAARRAAEEEAARKQVEQKKKWN